MKTVVALALIGAAIPTAPAVAGRPETASNDRRVCTQISLRAGSRMSGRRVCRTSAEWREALGPDWRQHLAGYTGSQDDYEAMQARTTPTPEDTGGVRPQRSRAGPSPL